MTPVQWKQVRAAFDTLLGLSGNSRAEYLARLEATDPELAREAMRLVQVHEELAPAWEPSAVPQLIGALAETPPQVPPRDLGPYHFLRFLGQGGMGTVYQAQHRLTGQLVAIKVLRTGELSAASRDRFATEQRALAKLNHPSIARLYASQTFHDGTPCFVMEYVEGETLTAYCNRHSSIRERLGLFRKVCEAVQHAHEHAIIHRDLKPSNILVKQDATVRLLDFGIAKQLDASELTAPVTALVPAPVTLSYASPEQVAGGSIGTQTDVYALGVILYELLTGRVPLELDGLTPGAAEQVIRFQDPHPPSRVSGKNQFERGLDWHDLDVLCATAIHKDPARRYRSVEALLRDVDHWLQSEPLEARSDTLRYRAAKFMGRNGKVLAATVAVIAILATAGIWFTVSLAHARDAAIRQEAKAKRIQQFVLSLFYDGDPDVGTHKSASALTMLDRGRQQASVIKDDPDFRAEIDEVLGHLYTGLGAYGESEQLLRSALAYRLTPANHSAGATASDYSALGLVEARKSNFAEAEKFSREALAVLRAYPNAGDEDVAEAETMLGQVLMTSTKFKEADPLLKDALRIEKRMPHADQSTEATALSVLASVEQEAGNYGRAETLNQQALALDQHLFGNSHVRVADDYRSIGSLYQVERRFAECVPPYRKALAIYQDWYGPDNPRTLETLIAMGQALVKANQFDAARAVLTDAVAREKQTEGAHTAIMTIAYSALGTLEENTNHLDDARQYFELAIQTAQKVYGENSVPAGVFLSNLGKLEQQAGNKARAEQLFRQSYADLKAGLPPNHPNLALVQLNLGKLLIEERQYAEARTTLEAALALLSRRTDSGTTAVVEIQNALQSIPRGHQN